MSLIWTSGAGFFKPFNRLGAGITARRFAFRGDFPLWEGGIDTPGDGA